MSMKKYSGHCVGQVGVPAIHNVIVELRNPIQLRQFLELVIRVTRSITQVLRFTDYEL